MHIKICAQKGTNIIFKCLKVEKYFYIDNCQLE